MDTKQELITAAEYDSIRDIIDFSNTDFVDPSLFYISLINFMNNEKTYPRQVLRDRVLKSLAEGEQKVRDEIVTMESEWDKLLEAENALRRNIPSAENTKKLRENLLEQENQKYAKRILRKQKALKKPSIDAYLDNAHATEENRQKLLTIKDAKLVEEHFTSGRRGVLGPFAVAAVLPFWESFTHVADSKIELPAIAVLQQQLIKSDDERMAFCCTQVQRNLLLMFICCEHVRALLDGKERDRTAAYKIPSATDLPPELASPKAKPIADLTKITAEYLEQANENLRILLANFIELNGHQVDDTEPVALLQVLSNYIESLLGKSHSHLGRSGRGPAQDLQGKLVGFKEWTRQSVNTLSKFIATIDKRLKTMQKSSVPPYTVEQLLADAQPKEISRTDSPQIEHGNALSAISTPLFKASESKAHSHRSQKHPRRGTLTHDQKDSPRLRKNTNGEQVPIGSVEATMHSPGAVMYFSPPPSSRDSTVTWQPALSRHRADSTVLKLVDAIEGPKASSPSSSPKQAPFAKGSEVTDSQKSSRSLSGTPAAPPTSLASSATSGPRTFDISAAVNAARIAAGTASPPGSPPAHSPYHNLAMQPPSSTDVAKARLTRNNSSKRGLPKYSPDGTLISATPPSPTGEGSRKFSKGSQTASPPLPAAGPPKGTTTTSTPAHMPAAGAQKNPASPPIPIPAANAQNGVRKMPGHFTAVDTSLSASSKDMRPHTNGNGAATPSAVTTTSVIPRQPGQPK